MAEQETEDDHEQYHQQFAVADIAKYLSHASHQGKYPVISVGSGNGRLEALLARDHQLEVICVDPDPETFGKEVYCEECPTLQPHYATVQQLIKKQPELKGNCVVLLCWPEPEPTSAYDLEAIALLQPKSIVLLFEFGGHAGTLALHAWLHEIAPDNGNTDVIRMLAEDTGQTEKEQLEEVKENVPWHTVDKAYLVVTRSALQEVAEIDGKEFSFLRGLVLLAEKGSMNKASMQAAGKELYRDAILVTDKSVEEIAALPQARGYQLPRRNANTGKK